MKPGKITVLVYVLAPTPDDFELLDGWPVISRQWQGKRLYIILDLYKSPLSPQVSLLDLRTVIQTEVKHEGNLFHSPFHKLFKQKTLPTTQYLTILRLSCKTKKMNHTITHITNNSSYKFVIFN